MLRVAHVSAGLIPDANDVKGEEHGVHEDGENGMEDMSDEHDALHQEQEEREDGDDDIELGGAGRETMSANDFTLSPLLVWNGGGLTMPPRAVGSERGDSWHSHR